MARTAAEISRTVVAHNVRALLKRRGWTQVDLKEKSGVSQSHISTILRRESDATTAVLEAFARAFHVPSWMLMVPGLPPELLDSPELQSMIERYVSHALTIADGRR